MVDKRLRPGLPASGTSSCREQHLSRFSASIVAGLGAKHGFKAHVTPGQQGQFRFGAGRNDVATDLLAGRFLRQEGAMRALLLVLTLLSIIVSPARADVLDDALADAYVMVERAGSRLDGARFGIELNAYRDALSLHRFRSSHWGGEMKLDIAVRATAEGDCARYAAYVLMPPENGTVTLVICPQFTDTGTRELRALTILHELVHVVAGPDECRAMSFAAEVEKLATGRHTNVERYWRANGCQNSGFRLP